MLLCKTEALQEVLVTRGTRSCILGEQGNKSLKTKGLGNREHRKSRFFHFEEQGKIPLYFGGTRK